MEAQLTARIARNDLGGGNFVIQVSPDLYDPSDPGTIYIQSATTIGSMSVTFDTNSSAGTASTGVASYYGPGLGAVVLVASRTAAGGNVTADISVDLDVKGAFS